MSFGLLSIAPYIAGYFVDEENASHEYVFGPAAEQLAKAIEKFNKENEG
jgi:hypothetical protein